MAKIILKKAKVKDAIHNIAQDFRFSGDVSESALMFYKADTDGELRGQNTIDKMVEYLETGLTQLKEDYMSLIWRKGYLDDNPSADEIKVIDNLQTIEKEYVLILADIQK